MRVLVACERSGKVREAFRKRGHNAVSCDVYPAEDGSVYHYQEDVRNVIRIARWDLIIAHPDCTYHTNSGVSWFTTIPKKPRPGVFYGAERWQEWQKAVQFFKFFQNEGARGVKVCIENPIPHCYSREQLGGYTQLIQPWQFGHKEMKATCLWLYGLPKLEWTDNVGPPPKDRAERAKWAKVHRASPGPNRSMDRARTMTGIAEAMAEQWGGGVAA